MTEPEISVSCVFHGSGVGCWVYVDGRFRCNTDGRRGAMSLEEHERSVAEWVRKELLDDRPAVDLVSWRASGMAELSKRRRALEISLKEVSRAVGESIVTVSAWERGEINVPVEGVAAYRAYIERREAER